MLNLPNLLQTKKLVKTQFTKFKKFFHILKKFFIRETHGIDKGNWHSDVQSE